MKGKKSSTRKNVPRKGEDREKAKAISVWSKKDEELAEEDRRDEELERETERDSE